jgi:hypothetical protein
VTTLRRIVRAPYLVLRLTRFIDIYIVSCSILAFLIIYAGGNVPAVDAFFFGCSGNTESGLNTVDVKALHTYQQLVIYFFPIVTNLGFINIAVVVVRLYWFEKTLKKHGNIIDMTSCPEFDVSCSAMDAEEQILPGVHKNLRIAYDFRRQRASIESGCAT